MSKFLIKIIGCVLGVVILLPSLQAQQLPTISGLVMEKGTGTRLGDVNVINLRTNKSTRTNVYGVFYIEATIGDSLSVSKTGYGPLKTILYTTEDVLLEMQAGLQIETVVVSRRTREQQMEDILKDYEKKGIYNGGKNRVGTYLNSPATALYNLFGREAKNMKRFEKFMDREVEEMAVDRIFSKAAVSQATGLKGEELQNFMDLYRPSFGQVERWGQYDLLAYIDRSLKSWDEQGRPAPQKLPKLEIPLQNK
ncbi:hypothetical protein G5B30_14855 [Sphingobacterium sp. SGG-5]|uniref:hypothetical protein n=1 Tax=Sphingobacterium sp. SGG-5 TaxID=2710881 RepID=UPI0013EB3792|nr:hypothetical protein [Sphingobacterium sp. SGG-5]NGM63187.1 hypothetical protein [Sphingobacterium sp. SGG-5]